MVVNKKNMYNNNQPSCQWQPLFIMNEFERNEKKIVESIDCEITKQPTNQQLSVLTIKLFSINPLLKQTNTH